MSWSLLTIVCLAACWDRVDYGDPCAWGRPGNGTLTPHGTPAPVSPSKNSNWRPDIDPSNWLLVQHTTTPAPPLPNGGWEPISGRYKVVYVPGVLAMIALFMVNTVDLADLNEEHTQTAIGAVPSALKMWLCGGLVLSAVSIIMSIWSYVSNWSRYVDVKDGPVFTRALPTYHYCDTFRACSIGCATDNLAIRSVTGFSGDHAVGHDCHFYCHLLRVSTLAMTLFQSVCLGLFLSLSGVASLRFAEFPDRNCDAGLGPSVPTTAGDKTLSFEAPVMNRRRLCASIRSNVPRVQKRRANRCAKDWQAQSSQWLLKGRFVVIKGADLLAGEARHTLVDKTSLEGASSNYHSAALTQLEESAMHK